MERNWFCFCLRVPRFMLDNISFRWLVLLHLKDENRPFDFCVAASSRAFPTISAGCLQWGWPGTGIRSYVCTLHMWIYSTSSLGTFNKASHCPPGRLNLSGCLVTDAIDILGTINYTFPAAWLQPVPQLPISASLSEVAHEELSNT
jgi:hypothetical protein